MAIISIGKNSIANQETIFDETNEFTRDMKKLNKKYNSIYEDFEIFKAALITALPAGLPGIYAISDLGDSIELPVYKVKKFRCKSLKGNGVKSGIRLIYTYYPSINMIYFIEAYHKNQQENEDRTRILKYLSES